MSQLKPVPPTFANKNNNNDDKDLLQQQKDLLDLSIELKD